jgi:hypothetical protein
MPQGADDNEDRGNQDGGNQDDGNQREYGKAIAKNNA